MLCHKGRESMLAWALHRITGLGILFTVQPHRFIFDNRDQASQERLQILAESNGVWRCRNIYNCTEACPREIQVTQAVAEVKREMMRRV